MSSKIFAHMQSNASLFSASIPIITGAWSGTGGACGGTPTDEALLLFFQELNETQIPNRMQVAILLTDGEPTLCYTTGATCDATGNSGNVAKATTAANAERWRPGKLPALGALFFAIGIGSSTNQALLNNYSSAPRMSFTASTFSALVNVTLPQVLDQLCFYAISGASNCTGATQTYTVKAYNFFPLQAFPKCRFQEIGTSNYYYSNATITMTNQTFLNESGTVSFVSCPAPVVPYDFAAFLEISREGHYYTSNEYQTTVRRQCNVTSKPICPGSVLQTFFNACTEGDLENRTCSADCAAASTALGNAFLPDFYLFDNASIAECINNFPGDLSTAVRAFVVSLTAPGVGPCPKANPPNPTTSGANTLAAGLLVLLPALALVF